MSEIYIPHNQIAEMSTLGSMLISEEAIEYCLDALSAEDFHGKRNRLVFASIQRLYNANNPVDCVTVVTELHNKGELEGAGDARYIADLMAETPSAANVAYYARQVRDCAIRRSIIKAGHAMFKDAQDNSISAEKLLAESEKRVFSVAVSEQNDTMRKASDLMVGAFNVIEKARESKGDVLGIRTGFYDLDKKIGALRNSDLVILAARPGVGKTSLATNIAQFAALQGNKSVAIFSLEMTAEQLMIRMVASESGKDLLKMQNGELSEKEISDIQICMQMFQDANLFIDDAPNVTIPAIRSKCRKIKTKHGLDLVIIDYLQLLRSVIKTENRNQEVSEITRAAKLLARELNVPVMMLSQLNRAVEKRGSSKPVLSDLRESGSIEQDADKVIFIYREEEDKTADINIAKHRNGPTGNVILTWLDWCATFKNYSGVEGWI